MTAWPDFYASRLPRSSLGKNDPNSFTRYAILSVHFANAHTNNSMVGEDKWVKADKMNRHWGRYRSPMSRSATSWGNLPCHLGILTRTTLCPWYGQTAQWLLTITIYSKISGYLLPSREEPVKPSHGDYQGCYILKSLPPFCIARLRKRDSMSGPARPCYYDPVNLVVCLN